MDFEPSDKGKLVEEQVRRFMDEYVYPAERTYAEQAAAKPEEEPAIMLELRARAKEIGLWNFFLPDAETGEGLKNLDYAYIAQILGRNPLSSECLNCSAIASPPKSSRGRVI